MFDDTKGYVKKCSQCQRFALATNKSSTNIYTLRSPWPFMQWGLDVVGPLPQAQHQLWFLLVVTDYFIKWVKAVSLSEVTGQQIVKFL